MSFAFHPIGDNFNIFVPWQVVNEVCEARSCHSYCLQPSTHCQSMPPSVKLLAPSYPPSTIQWEWGECDCGLSHWYYPSLSFLVGLQSWLCMERWSSWSWIHVGNKITAVVIWETVPSFSSATTRSPRLKAYNDLPPRRREGTVWYVILYDILYNVYDVMWWYAMNRSELRINSCTMMKKTPCLTTSGRGVTPPPTILPICCHLIRAASFLLYDLIWLLFASHLRRIRLLFTKTVFDFLYHESKELSFK
jgi:hypothetical protein